MKVMYNFSVGSFMKIGGGTVTDTLLARDYKDPQCVAIGIDRASYNMGENAKYGMGIDEEKIGAETSKGPGAVCAATYQETAGCLNPGGHPRSYNGQDAYNDMLVAKSPCVRRLTPTECERLQGYPDGWTDIGEWTDSKGKRHKEADSPRYKALGNSIALPFWQFLLNRIAAECKEKTMVSLFDGIGGFPLCWKRAGGETLWVSEIEEFCIAVTKKRFGEETK